MSGCGFAVPAKSDIKTWKDMVGKRVAVSPGTPLVEDATLAFLAYGGVTKNDVQQIVVTGMNGAYNSVIDGTIDGAYLPFEGSSAYTMESSPKGLRWLPMDPDDVEGWKRLQVYLPMYAPFISRTGAGCSEENPVVGGGYAMGFFAYRDVSEEIMYLLTKSIYENYDEYKDVSKDLKYWDQALLIDVEKHLFPLHAGAVRYLKEKGLWTPNMDRWQQWREWQEAGRLASWPIVVAQATEKKLKVGSPEFLALWISYIKEKGFYSTPGKAPADWKASN
jgi:TRAP transporter TAXI family solute receptor